MTAHHSSAQILAHHMRVLGVRDLRSDSRQIHAGDAFIAWSGYGVDARDYIAQAIQGGALACVSESETPSTTATDTDTDTDTDINDRNPHAWKMHQLKQYAGSLASEFYDNPSRYLKVCAVTGTNGKTSIAWGVAQTIEALSGLSGTCGMVGTLGMGPVHDIRPTGLTTPDPIQLQRQLSVFHREGFSAVALEASSIGIAEHRLQGTQIHTAVFSNFTHDHLDYHQSMQAYWQAKEQLFAWDGLQRGIVNIDDEKGVLLQHSLHSRGVPCWTYSLSQAADFTARNIQENAAGIDFELHYGGKIMVIRLPALGLHHVANCLAVVAAVASMGYPLTAVVAAYPLIQSVPGRMECIALSADQPLAIVDYAHTPDALDKALRAARRYAQMRGGRVLCVFGCGGNRDSHKRPVMGSIAQQYADQIILTDDNPRNESSALILEQILLGIAASSTPVLTIPNRQEAIYRALQQARACDVVLIAGKGHETYQEIAGVQHHFSDQEQARDALVRMQKVKESI